MYRIRKLTPKLHAYYSLRFPYKKRCLLHYRKHKAVIGVGGNIGDVKRRFEKLFVLFCRDKRVGVIATSLILKNPPFGYDKQDDFLNAIMILDTSMQPKVLLQYLLRIEKKFGRKRSFANAPRTLDLDIIFFDNRNIKTPSLQLPHPEWNKRDSVVIPLMEIVS